MVREKQITIWLETFTLDFNTTTGSHCGLMACSVGADTNQLLGAQNRGPWLFCKGTMMIKV